MSVFGERVRESVCMCVCVCERERKRENARELIAPSQQTNIDLSLDCNSKKLQFLSPGDSAGFRHLLAMALLATGYTMYFHLLKEANDKATIQAVESLSSQIALVVQQPLDDYVYILNVLPSYCDSVITFAIVLA